MPENKTRSQQAKELATNPWAGVVTAVLAVAASHLQTQQQQTKTVEAARVLDANGHLLARTSNHTNEVLIQLFSREVEERAKVAADVAALKVRAEYAERRLDRLLRGGRAALVEEGGGPRAASPALGTRVSVTSRSAGPTVAGHREDVRVDSDAIPEEVESMDQPADVPVVAPDPTARAQIDRLALPVVLHKVEL